MRRKRYGRSILAHVFWTIVRSPWPIIGFIEMAMLTLAVLAVFRGFAGYMPDGRMLGVSSALLIGVGTLHLIRHLGDSSSHLRLYREMFYPLPFIGYVLVHFLWLSDSPWNAGLYLAVLLQAYAVFCLSLSVPRHGTARSTYLILLHVIHFVVLLVGFLQFYLFPEWMPFADRVRPIEFGYGPAGFFTEPSNLGALVLLVFPSAIFILWLRRFSGPVRILMGLISVAGLVGYFLTAHIWGLMLLVVFMLILPLLILQTWRGRRKFYLWGTVLLLVLMPFAWFGTDALQSRMEMIWGYTQDELAASSREIAYEAALSAPILGNGYGAFPVIWQQNSGPEFQSTVAYPVGWFADILAELGVVGLLLALVPVVLIWIRGLRYWNSLLLFRPDPDIEKRIKGLSPRRKEMMRRKLAKGRSPAPKVVLGGLLFSWLFFGLYLLQDNALRFAGVWICFAITVGIVVVFTYEGISLGKSQRGKVVLAGFPLIVALIAFSFGYPKFAAAYLLQDSTDRLRTVLNDRYRIFQDPAVVHEIETQLDLVLELYPDHGEALAWKGETILARTHMDLFPAEEIATAALPYLNRAVELSPNLWRAHYNHARALGMLGREESELLESLDRAVELASNRVEPLAFASAIRIIAGIDSDSAAEDFRAARLLSPGYAPAAVFSDRLQMSGGNRGSAGVILRSEILAVQFELAVGASERMAGSGRLDPDAIGGTLAPAMQ